MLLRINYWKHINSNKTIIDRMLRPWFYYLLRCPRVKSAYFFPLVLLPFYLSSFPYQNPTIVKRTRIVLSYVFGHSHKVYLFQHLRCAKCISKYRNSKERKLNSKENLLKESKATVIYFLNCFPLKTI